MLNAARLRGAHVPLAYILGQTWFMNHRFKTGPGTLVPRPDSEVLVESALEALFDSPASDQMVRVLDVCAGTGCIGISLLLGLIEHGRPAELVLTEIDSAAAGFARQNIKMHHLEALADLVQADLFPTAEGLRFDLIVSNPPYIPSADIAGLMPEVSSHEPKIALDGGPDGLAFYRRLVATAPDYLKPNGLLLVEHGFDQHQPVLDLFARDGRYDRPLARRDYGGQPRVTGSRLKS